MCDLQIEELSTPPANPDRYVDIAIEARARLEVGQAFAVTPPKGKGLGPFLSGVQRAINDTRYDERFDAYPDAGNAKAVVRRTR